MIFTLPVHNEEKTLAKTVAIVYDYLTRKCPMDFTILIAEDGSTDRTKDIAYDLQGKFKHIEVITNPNKLGRGLALRKAWKKFQDGDFYAFIDVDMAVPLDQFDRLMDAVLNRGYDAAVGSRYTRGSTVERPFMREFVSRRYNDMMRLAFQSKLQDHQCGFRLFTKRFVQEIILPCRSVSWFLDTECMVMAQAKGFKIAEIGVDWIERREAKHSSSMSRIIKDVKLHGLGMAFLFIDLFQLKLKKYIEFIKFCFVGFLGFLFVSSITIVTDMFLTTVWVIIANSVAYLAAMVLQHFINKYFTFKVAGKDKQRLVLDIATRIVGMGINFIAFAILVNIISVFMSTVFSTAISTTCNYVLNKLFVFSPDTRAWGKLAELWGFIKQYKIPILANLVICVVTIFVMVQCCLLNNWFKIENITKNDYAVYYEFSRFLMQGRLMEIYDDSLIIEAGTYQFRYFPTFLVLMVPFAVIGDLAISYAVFCISSFGLNVVSIYLIVRTIQKYKPGTNIAKYIWLFLLSFPQLSNYATGQPTSFVLFCIAASFYYYFNDKERQASILLGISMIFKPMMYGIIIFTVLTSRSIKQAIKRGFYSVLPLWIDACLFIAFPSLFQGFLRRNLGEGGSFQFSSLSFINWLVFMVGGYTAILFVTIAGIFIIAGYWYIHKATVTEQRILLSFILGALLFFIIQPQLWMASLVLLIPLLPIAVVLLEKKGENYCWLLCNIYNVASTYLVFQLVFFDLEIYFQAPILVMIIAAVASPIAIEVLIFFKVKTLPLPCK
ncbi:MAG: glycosyltransferase [Candidatus Sigynarchaeota archaeon]